MDQGFSEKLQKIENILHDSLPASYSVEWKSDSFGTIADCVSDMHLDVLQAPCRNLLNLGGKRWRPLLLVLCAEMTARQNSKSKENQEKYNEASTAYANAFKRIKVIMTFLNGEVSQDANVSTEDSGTLTGN